MTDLSVGALFGTVELTTVSFDRAYARVVAKMSELGSRAGQAASETTVLDRGLTQIGAASDKASAGMQRASQSAARTAAAEEKAAVAAQRHAKATADVAAVLNDASDASAREQRAALGLLGAQDRLTAAQESGTATTRQLAAAQSSLIGATERVAAAQRAATAETEASVAGYGKAEAGMGGLLKTAGELGLVIGGIEIAKKAIEFISAGKDLTDSLNNVQAASRATNTQMKQVRAEAVGLGKDLRVPGATAVDAADAILDLVKAGVTLPRAMAAARAALLLASAANVDTADSARVLGDVLDEFKLPASAATKTASILAAAANASAGGLMGMFEAFTYVGTRARALGLGVADIAAAITDLSKAGIGADRAGTGLAMMFQRLAAESPKGQKALDDMGIKAWDAQGKFVGLPKVIEGLSAAQQRFGVGSKRFVKDVSDAFGARAANVASAFALKGVESYNRILKLMMSGDVQKFADLQNRGVAAGFRQLGKEATAAGIDIYHSAEPALTSMVALTGKALPEAFDIAKSAAVPFVVVWRGLADVLGPVVHLGGELGGALGPAAPVLKDVAAGALALWAAFKGYEVARAAIGAIQVAVASSRATFGSALVDAQRYGVGSAAMFRGTAAEAEATGAIMQAEFDQIGAAALQSAADVARAEAIEAQAFSDATAASSASTDVQVADADARATAAWAAARAAAQASTVASTAAEESSAAIALSGDVARAGWMGIAGPIGIAAVAVLSVIGMFHKSSSASKEATDAAKAYTDALSGAGGTAGKTTLIDAITKQLSNNKVPETVDKLNKALGSTSYSGKQFVDAIENGNPALSTLQTRLEAVIKSGTKMPDAVGGKAAAYIHTSLTPAAKAASKLLTDLNTQYNTLSKSAQEELAGAKTFKMTATSIDKTTVATKVGSDAAKQYATMMGIFVDKNGIAAVSSKTLNAAVSSVADAYSKADSAGNDFLAALDTFSKSTGTAADRATLIGAILKANAGDSLDFASAMNSASTAVAQLGKDVTGKLLRQVVNLSKGTIDYSKTAAAPLISDLQGIQTAAINAAQATYQHEVATKGGTKAADDAVAGYSGVERSLEGQLHQMGLTTGQAKRLTEQYLGVPKNVRTQIEAAGANPVVTVLNKIGQQLAILTHHPWSVSVKATAQTAALERFRQLLTSIPHNYHIDVTASNNARLAGQAVGTQAAFGQSTIPPNTAFTVGERGWEGGVTDSQGRASIFSHSKSIAMGFIAPVGYASGTGGNEGKIASALSSAFGLTRAQLAGILANLDIESHFNPLAHNAGENAWGIAQWEGSRLTALQNYAAKHHESFKSLDAQIGYLIQELRGSSVLRQIRSMSNAGNVAALVDAQFERSKGTTRGARVSAAGSIYNQLRSGHLSAAGGGGGQITTTTVGGKKKWEYGGQLYASETAAINARARASGQTASAAKSSVSSAISAIGQAGSSSNPIDLSQISYPRVVAQIAAASAALHRAIGRGLSKSAARSAQAQITNLRKDAEKQLAALRVHINTSDVATIRSALKGTASDVETAFATMIGDITRAGGSSSTISRIKAAEVSLLANQRALTAATTTLAGMKDYRSSTEQTLAGAFDSTQYGSIADLHAGFATATGRNNTYAGQLTKLLGEAAHLGKGGKADTTLMAYFNQLAAAGETTTLGTLAGTNLAGLRNVSKDVAGYNTSLLAGGNAATVVRYGGNTIAAQTQAVSKLAGAQTTQANAVAQLAAAIGRSAAKPTHVTVQLHGHQIAEAVTKDPALAKYVAGVLHKLEQHHTYGIHS